MRVEAAELDAMRKAEEKEQELRLKEDAAATGPGEHEILHLLRAAARPHAFDRVPEMDELEAWALSAPLEFRGLVKPYLTHRDAEVAVIARHLDGLREEAEECAKFLASIDTGLQPVAGLRREILWKETWHELPNDPWSGRNWFSSRGICESDERRADRIHNSGIARDGRSSPWQRMNTEIRDYVRDRSSFRALSPDEQFWRAVLYARWATEGRLGRPALDCFRISKQVAHEAWPEEDDKALAARIARHASALLVHDASMSIHCPYDELILWSLVEELPVEFRPAGNEAALARIRRYRKGSERWTHALLDDRLPAAEQAEIAFWAALTWSSGAASDGRAGAVLETARNGKSSRDEPVAWLRSLGWVAVPLLIEHLDDSTATSTFDGDYRVKVGDVSWLALRSFAGLPNPEGIPADDLWHLRNSDGRALRAAFQDWWKRLEPLPEEDRWAALRKDGSTTATEWLLENAPERCLPDAWTRLDPDTRAGQLGRRAVLKLLSLAPRARLEALCESTDGDLREALIEVLKPAPPK
ncbi:MAG: hypothetical protein K8T20_12150 [Planctomycetes bacterium]|nr:hypothetical protein [Planctomycetota bacterium]